MSQSSPLLVVVFCSAVAVAVAMFASIDRAEPKNDREVPFPAKVVKEKVLCVNDRKSCVQELRVVFGGEEATIIKKHKPWIRLEATISLIRVHTEQFGLPGCSKGGRCSDALTYHYELFQTHNKKRNRTVTPPAL